MRRQVLVRIYPLHLKTYKKYYTLNLLFINTIV